MQRTVKLLFVLLAIIATTILVSNIIVVVVSKGRCYDDINAIPHNTYGLLLGTGRSSKPSPYYDARIQAAIDLYHAGKVDSVVVSAENLYADYNEVDSMVAALNTAGVPVAFVDYHGTDTYASLHTFGKVIGHSSPPTVISQHYHNQRAVYYAATLFHEPTIAYNAADTDIWYWNLRRVLRESLARTKAVLAAPIRPIRIRPICPIRYRIPQTYRIIQFLTSYRAISSPAPNS